MGAPKAKIDWKVVGDMLAAGCKGTEVAASIGIAPYTLYERCSEDKGILFTHFAQECREKGNSMLHAAQFKNAMKGNTSMQIWLGKQRLGQKDKPGEDEKDATIRELIKMVQSLTGLPNTSEPGQSDMAPESPLLHQDEDGV